jgi:hypothetical protein
MNAITGIAALIQLSGTIARVARLAGVNYCCRAAIIFRGKPAVSTVISALSTR